MIALVGGSGDPDRQDEHEGMPGAVAPSQALPGHAEYPDGPPGALDGLVQIAYPHTGTVSHSWHQSMMGMLTYDKAVGSNSIGSAPFMISCSGPHGLVEARNLAASHFLDQTDHEWLFFIDTDMGFIPQSLDVLLQAASPDERPVVGGLCFAFKQMEADGRGGFKMQAIPTLFGLAKDRERHIGFVNRAVYPENSLVQVAGTGAAFLLIHRSALESVRAKHGDTWFDMVSYENGKPISEDLSFCWRLGDLGVPIFVHTGLKITHHKEIWVDDLHYRMPDVDAVFKTARGDQALPQREPEPTVETNRAARRQRDRAKP